MKKVQLSESVRILNLLNVTEALIEKLQLEVKLQEAKIKVLQDDLQLTQGRNISDLMASMVLDGAELLVNKKTNVISVGMIKIDNGLAYLGDNVYFGEVDFTYLTELDSFIEFVELNDIAHLVDYEYPERYNDLPDNPITLSRNDLK